MRNECNIVRDLLPLYVEDMVSADTRAFVQEHLNGCEACRRELAALHADDGLAGEKETEASRNAEARLLKKLARKWNVRRMLLPLILIAAAVILWNWFYVDGGEIELVEEIDRGCTGILISSPLLGWEERTEYELLQNQMPQVKALLMSTSYTRVLSNTVYGFDPDLYDIRIDFNDGQRFLSIHILGDDYISVVGQFGGKHLKINNQEAWKAALEDLLPATD